LKVRREIPGYREKNETPSFLFLAISNVSRIFAEDSGFKLFGNVLPLFRAQTYLLFDFPQFGFSEIIGFMNDSFHAFHEGIALSQGPFRILTK